MWQRTAIGIMGIVTGLCYWPVESLIHAFVFNEGAFMDKLLHPDANEIWMRALIMASFMAFGLFSQHAVNRQRRLLAQLQEQHARTQRIIDAAYDAFVAMDEEGHITGWNIKAERMFGRLRHEVMGRRLADLLIPERLRPAHQRGMQRYRESAAGPWLYRPVRTRALHKNGHEFDVEIVVMPMKSQAGQEFYAFIRDRTATPADPSWTASV